MTVSTALSVDDVASLREAGSAVGGPCLYPVPLATVATMRINQVVFEKPLAAIEVDGATGFDDIEAGMTYWIGTTAGARDVHVGRVRGKVTNFLLVEEFSSGDPGMLRLSELKSLANDLYITVKKEYNLWSVFPRISYSGGVNARVGTFYKDFNIAYMDQNATVPAGILRIGQHRVSRTSPASFAFSAFAENWAVGTVDTYAWDLDGGSVTAGAADEQHVTGEFTTGFYVVSCTVTFDTGAEVTARRFVWVNQAGVPITVNNDTRDTLGRRMTFSTAESLLTLPDGVMAVYHEEASWGGDTIAEATTQFVGFVSSIEHAQADSIQRRNFEMVSPLVLAQSLASFPQGLDKNSDPENWQEAIHLLMRLDYWVFYLIYYHSTLLTLFDMEITGNTTHLTQSWWTQSSSIEGALSESGSRLNCTVGQDSRGTIFIRRNPLFMNTTDRDAVIERMTLTGADIKKNTLNWGNNEVRNATGRVEASGFSYDGTVMTPYESNATGYVGGQGARIGNLQNQLLYAFGDPQAELNQRAACQYAIENNPYDNITLTLLGDYDVFEPSERYWIRLDVDATLGPNGQAFDERCLVKTVSKIRLEGGAVEIALALEAEVYADENQAQTEEIIAGEGANAGVQLGNSFLNLPTFTPAGLLDFPYDPFSIPPYSYPPTAYAQDTATTTAYVLAWTAGLLYNSANLGGTWGTLYNPSDDIIGFVHDNESPFLTDVTGALIGWLLTAAGLLYNDDMLGGGSWTSKLTFTGGVLLRKPAGVTDGIAVYGITEDMERAGDGDGEGDWTLIAWNASGTGSPLPSRTGIGTYNGVDDRWEGARLGAAEDFVGAKITWQAQAVVTRIEYEVTINATDNGTLGSIGALIAFDDVDNMPSLVQPPSTGVHVLAGDTGQIYQYADTIELRVSATAYDDGTYCYINWIEVTFADGTVKYSSDNATFDTVSVGTRAGLNAADTDDYGEGVHVIGAATAIYYTSAYDQATADELTGLDGINGTAEVSVVRVPAKKLASQALNDDATSLQFIYGTKSAVSGSTLWGVTFDASDGSIIAQSDMTPVISGTTYYVISMHALETSGADTRVILAFMKPVGGGSTKLGRTSNGGASWAIANTFDGDFVRWIAGSTQAAWLSSGVRYTTNRGSTLQNKNTGITGDVLGVQGF